MIVRARFESRAEAQCTSNESISCEASPRSPSCSVTWRCRPTVVAAPSYQPVLGVGAAGLGVSRRAALLRDQRPLYSPPHRERTGGGSIGGPDGRLLPAALLAALSALPRGPGGGRWSPTPIRGEFPVGWRGVLAEVFLVHTFSPTTFDGLNPPAWTLAVETQLYLAYPARLGALRAPRGLARAWRRACGDHALSHQL